MSLLCLLPFTRKEELGNHYVSVLALGTRNLKADSNSSWLRFLGTIVSLRIIGPFQYPFKM